MAFTNPGPAIETTVNTQSPVTNLSKHQLLAVNFGVIAAVGAATTAEIMFAGLATGLRPGDVIIDAVKPTAQAGLAIGNCRVDALLLDTFYITYINTTAGALTPTANEVYQMAIVRPLSLNPVSQLV